MDSDLDASRHTLHRYWIGIGTILFSSICYATKAIFVKLSYRYQIDPITALTLRMLIAAPFFIAPLLFHPQSKRRMSTLTIRDWVNVFIVGSCGFYLSAIFDFTGLQYISASLERIILFSYPTIVLISSWLFFGTRVGMRQGLAVAICYFGIAISFLSEMSFGGTEVARGSLYVGACACTYAFFIIGSGRLIPKVGSSNFAALAMLSATAAVLIHFLVTSPPSQLVQALPVYGIVGMMAIISTVIPSYLLSLGISRVGSNVASIVGSIGPVATIAMAYLFLGEPVTGSQLLGSGLVIGGVLLVSAKRT